MNKAVRAILGVIAISFLVFAVIVLMQQLTGAREPDWVLPCVLAAGSFGAGWFAWNFSSGAGSSDICTSDQEGSEESDEHHA